ncbi:methyltransferase domain-containing protein [Plantactinospora sp. B5E13]|uniref:class I SAM-dependent methyltransferase n=1 Tax=Plantactinospora sp. B5E13 TaxID=3153758 RepID=UPI00325E1A81
MTRIVNTEQDVAWNGAEGAHWAEHNDGDPVNRELTEALLVAAGIGPTTRLLDIGCGTGESTRMAARLAPHGHALGLDLSAVMLERARAAAGAAGLDNVTFEQGDAQVYPFAEGQYDVAVSQFGIMFFADPVAAFRNIGRALRPGGRLVFLCPREMTANAWYVVPIAALDGGAGRLPDSAMFSLADPAQLTALLTDAGFREVRPEPLDLPMAFGTDLAEATGFYLGSGPVRAVLERSPDLTPELARTLLVEALRPYQEPDGVRIPGANWLVTATRP